ncbi:MAG: GYF domain-containing protein [Verrucomicrobiota bacterium]|nr:GYF domain-containing protein [Verrucomicrobiota bacterium]
MEIFILRDGKEIGPLNEDTVQTLLKQGNVLVTDPAWCPGMPQWIPLVNVLYPAATPLSQTPPPPPPGYGAPQSFEPEPVAVSEPATGKQKAYLTYLGIPFDPDLAKEEAAVLLNDAMEKPELQGHVAKWNEDRLRLYPELFAAEIHAKKENRANHFCEVCHIEGAEVFTNVTKAHCQVLVGYLDVRFPHWDANEREAVWSYFFPAMAEKFPQLVSKKWRGKLKYPSGRKVAPELSRRAPVPPGAKRRLPVGALARGLVGGLAILALLYGGTKLIQSGWLQRIKIPLADRPAAPKPQDPAQAAAKSAAAAPAPAASGDSPKPAIASENPAAPVSANPSAPTPAAMPGEPAPEKPPDAGTPPAVPAMASNTVMLFNPPASSDPANPSAPTALPSPVPEPVTAMARLHVKLIKPVDVPSPFGRITLPAGTFVKLLGREGENLRVRHLESDVLVPAASTDFSDTPPSFFVPPPAPSESTPPPPEAPAPSPTPTPKPPAESLF